MKREAFAELLGSLLLSAAVIGSGIMAERLAAGSAAFVIAELAGAVVGLALLRALADRKAHAT